MAQVFRGGKNWLGKALRTPSNVGRSLKRGTRFRTSQSNVREPGVNPGRLRHCNGYKFQVHWSKDREGGTRLEAGVRIPIGLFSSVPDVPGHFSAKRRMRPARPICFWSARRIYLHSSFAQAGGFLFPPPSLWSLNHRRSGLCARGFNERSVLNVIHRRLAYASLLTATALVTRSLWADGLTETFTSDPAASGWLATGKTNLFHWDAANHNLAVTWDSTSPNSYFYHPLGRTLSRADGFTLAFDLRLDDISITGFGQQIALGLLNLAEATHPNFSRPNSSSPDICEFDYYTDTGFGYSLDGTVADFTESAATYTHFQFNYSNDPLPIGVVCHVVLNHAPGASGLTGGIYTNGVLYSALNQVYANPIIDFQVDALAIESYAGDGWGDDVLAHGAVDNLTLTATPAVASDTQLLEGFFSDPFQRDWHISGNTNLYFWDATNQNLAVTWDSSTSNTYCYKSLGTTLGKADAFSLDFDLQLKDLTSTNTFQLAVGLLNLAEATNPGFSRPLGTSPDLFEFNYFADNGLGDPNVAATLTDHTAQISDYPGFYFAYNLKPLTAGQMYHIHLSHAAGAGTVTGRVSLNGTLYAELSLNYAGAIGEFRLDTLSISSYSGAGQDPDFYPGALLAHGAVDNVQVTLPAPTRNPVLAVNNGQWQLTTGTYLNWHYTLQRSSDLVAWSDISAPVPGTGGLVTMTDVTPPADRAYYRVQATQP